MSIALSILIQNMKNCNEEIEKMNRYKKELQNDFFNCYPVEITDEKLTVVDYYGEEYVVTEVNFNDFTVLLETQPYMDDNQIEKVSFELFFEIYRESHRDILINRSDIKNLKRRT